LVAGKAASAAGWAPCVLMWTGALTRPPSPAALPLHPRPAARPYLHLGGPPVLPPASTPADANLVLLPVRIDALTARGAGRAELLQLLPRECADRHADRRPHGAARGFFLPSVYVPLSALTLISSVVACAVPELGSPWWPPTVDEDDGWIRLREGESARPPAQSARAIAWRQGRGVAGRVRGRGRAPPAGHDAGERWTLAGKKRNTWGYLQN
jgi:hypothetical protein